MPIALLFSGQGSQYVGMIKDICEKYPQAKELILSADGLLGFSLSEICFEGPIDLLKETRYTQPALFLHSAVLVSLLKEKLSFDAVAGHSVGEYAALFAGRVIGFEDALSLVALRGKLMFEAGGRIPGTMFAIIGMDDEKVLEICKGLTEKCGDNCITVANFNSPGQVVVSGSRDYLRENIGAFRDAGAKMTTELAVSGAFHSPLMQPAKEALEKAILSTHFDDARIPVYTNVLAKPTYKSDELKKALILQLTSPVLWTQTLLNMKSDGISKYIEIGPGKVLQGLVKRTLKEVEIGGYDKAEEVDN